MKRAINILGVLLITAIFSSCQLQTENQKPNVLLFMVDDYGYGDISFEGNTVVKTPGIDRIATEGTHFTRFYQSAGACAPTRAALLTGRDYLRTGVWGVHWGRDFVKLDENTLGNLMQSAGYKTGAFGKWHSGKTWAYLGWNRGFDDAMATDLYKYWNTQVIWNNKVVKVDGPIPNVVADRAIDFITENKDNPFFCYVPFQSVHGPYNCPEKLFKKFKDMGYSNHVARWMGMVEKMDENVGRILNTLDENNLTDNTIVMFMVDDGCGIAPDLNYGVRRMTMEEHEERAAAWGYRIKGTKAQIWEGGSRSPFYIRWPGHIKAGGEIDAISGVVDIYPTLAEICGIPLPDDQKELSGRSFYSFLKGEKPANDERVYFDNTNLYKIEEDRFNIEKPEIREMSLQYKDYKYIRFDKTIYGENVIDHHLYNLKDDPTESNNLAEVHPDFTKELEQKTMDRFDDILQSEHAFAHTVYQVGHWQERVSPINLDGAHKVLGTLQRDKGSGFDFGNWTEKGNGLSFLINVVEEGEYQIELFKTTKLGQTNGIIAAYTQHDSITGTLTNADSDLLEGTLHLPKGEQILTIELIDHGKSAHAMDLLKFMAVHRIPQPEDQVLKKAGIKVYNLSNSSRITYCRLMAETLNYLYKYNAIYHMVDQQSHLKVDPLAQNMDLIKSVEYFLDFKSIGKKEKAPFDFEYSFEKPGNYTLNVEFTDINGIKNSSRVQIEVK